MNKQEIDQQLKAALLAAVDRLSLRDGKSSLRETEGKKVWTFRSEWGFDLEADKLDKINEFLQKAESVDLVVLESTERGTVGIDLDVLNVLSQSRKVRLGIYTLQVTHFGHENEAIPMISVWSDMFDGVRELDIYPQACLLLVGPNRHVFERISSQEGYIDFTEEVKCNLLSIDSTHIPDKVTVLKQAKFTNCEVSRYWGIDKGVPEVTFRNC